MARGDLSMERIVLGAALGIGAVAAAPFTGGGSVLGAATLAGSLWHWHRSCGGDCRNCGSGYCRRVGRRGGL